MAKSFSEIQNAKTPSKNTSAAGKNEKRQNYKMIPKTTDTAGKDARFQKGGK